jgi:AraC-like DNA-binding protein
MARKAKTHAMSMPELRAVVDRLTLSGGASLDQVAEQLGTSPRTLQRRLHAQGLSFRWLVMESALGVSAAFLCETELSVQEIAARIGYGSPGAFSRAFARWAGRTPMAYRKRCSSRHRSSSSLARNGQR